MTACITSFLSHLQHLVQKPPDIFCLSLVLVSRKLVQLSEQRASVMSSEMGGWGGGSMCLNRLLQSFPFIESILN